MSRIKDTHVLHCYRVILYEAARSAKYNDAAVSGISDDIVSGDAVGTAEADTVSPLLERVSAARTDIVVLNGDASASECTFGDVKAGPRTGVE